MTDANYLRRCYEFAALTSDDPDTQNGALLVMPGKESPLASGCNGAVEGVKAAGIKLVRPQKYDYIIHAEQDVIATAACFGIKTEGATMYCPWAPCVDCAKLVIQAGIVRLVADSQMHAKRPSRWKDSSDRAVRWPEFAGGECVRDGGSCVWLYDRCGG